MIEENRRVPNQADAPNEETMALFNVDIIEALADAWASIDGKVDEFREGKGQPLDAQPGGHYDGYMADAKELALRLHRRGISIVKR